MPDARTEKKNAIFDAVIRLIEDKGGTQGVTVSGISNAAGIGKGMVYEYFSSRDELIAGAVVYWINCRLNEANAAAEKAKGFENKIKAVFEYIKNARKSKKCLFSMLMADGASLFSAVIEAGEKNRINDSVEHYIDGFIREGIGEKLISPSSDMDFLRYAMKNAFLGYIALTPENSDKEFMPDTEKYALDVIMKAVG